MFVYICTYESLCTFVCLCMYVLMIVYVYLCVCLCTYVRLFMYVCVFAYVRTYDCLCMFVYIYLTQYFTTTIPYWRYSLFCPSTGTYKIWERSVCVPSWGSINIPLFLTCKQLFSQFAALLCTIYLFTRQWGDYPLAKGALKLPSQQYCHETQYKTRNRVWSVTFKSEPLLWTLLKKRTV